MMPDTITIIVGVGIFIVAIVAGFILGIAYRKKVAEAEIGSAEEKAKAIVADAERLAKSKKKETLLEAKEEIIRNRNEAERELKERRNEVSRLEKRALQREEAIEHKYEAFEKKEEALAAKMKETEARLASIEEVKQQQIARLEEISGLTIEEAKQDLLGRIEEELTHETAIRIAEAEARFKEDADQKAPGDYLHRYPALCRRPGVRGHCFCRSPAERRHEGKNYRQRGAQHPDH